MKLAGLLSVFIYAVLIIGLSFLIPVDSVLAQGGSTGLVPCTGEDCNFCHFIELGNNVLNWLFTIVFVIFGVIMVVAGFELVTSGGNRSRLDDAKKKLSNALIGIVIMFAAWLLVDTLLKGVLDQNFGPWNQIDCSGGQTQFQQVSGTGPGVTTNGPTTNGGTAGADEAASRAALQNVGISVNNNGRACPAGTTYQQFRNSNGGQGCTSVAGLNPALISAIGTMNSECGSMCNGGQLMVTGGTEAGHAGCNPAGQASCSNPGSHSAGDKVDFGVGVGSNGPALTSYFNDNTYFTNGLQGTRPARVHRTTGVACVFEGSHWDCQRPLP